MSCYDSIIESLNDRLVVEKMYLENESAMHNVPANSETHFKLVIVSDNFIEMTKVKIIGGVDNPAREGLVSLVVDGLSSSDVVKKLNEQGIRTHLRKADHYSGNILDPLGLDGCVRVSMCHYNSEHEVALFLAAMKTIAA